MDSSILIRITPLVALILLASSCGRFSGSVRVPGDAATSAVVSKQNSLRADTIAVSRSGVHELTGNHACGIFSGALKCWGDNRYGQLGAGSVSQRILTAVQVQGFESGTKDVSPGGYWFTCAIKSDSTLWCWGFGTYGQLGDGNSSDSLVPVQVVKTDDTPLSDVISVSAADTHVCALDAAGDVWCWGWNGSGQLGNNTVLGSSKADRVLKGAGQPLTQIVEVSAGPYHNCARDLSGNAWCWGDGSYGQLGDNNTASHNSQIAAKVLTAGPVPLASVTSVAVGVYHSCAADSVGRAWCWGNSGAGYLGNNTSYAGSAGMAIQVLKDTSGTPLTGIASVSAEVDHTCALAQDGTAWCWGQGLEGVIGNNATAISSIAVQVKDPDNPAQAFSGLSALTVGVRASCALKDGRIWCWGHNTEGALGFSSVMKPAQYLPVQTKITSGAAALNVSNLGSQVMCAVMADTTLKCWGHGEQGGLGRNSVADSAIPDFVLDSAGTNPITGIVSVSTATGYGESTCAVDTSHRGWCWGGDVYGKNGQGGGGGSYIPTQVKKTAGTYFTNILAISTSAYHSCAVDTTGGAAGQAWCWGQGDGGRLGNNSVSNQNYPVQVYLNAGSTIPLSTAKQIGVGYDNSCALDMAGAVWCWGDNAYGQLGNGETSNAYSYGVRVAKDLISTPLTNITNLSTGTYHSCAVDSSNYVWCWGGEGWIGLLGDGSQSNHSYAMRVKTDASTYLAGISQVSTSESHTCAVTTGGNAWCWGDNFVGELGSGEANLNISENYAVQVRDPDNPLLPLSGALEIAAGTQTTCARLTGGAVKCWGMNRFGTLGTGTPSMSALPVLHDLWR